MSIYAKPLSDLTFADLEELLAQKAIESVRLEFKREIPDKDETLKKLSSFANTLGGLVVVGAAAGNDGRITALGGVPEQPSYKQTVIQWCFEGVSPALDIEVSDPIPIPESDSVCYVISVRESAVAPHFVNGRRGVWVRTDEFSSRVTSELATSVELQQLLNRRQVVTDRRRAIVARSRERFATFTDHSYAELGGRAAGIGARFELSIGPTFPMARVCTEAQLLAAVQSTSLDWRQVGFPRRSASGVISQQDSAIVLRPGSSFSILEASVWGMLFYASEIEGSNGPAKQEGIHTYHFAGQLEIFLRHAAHILRTIGYRGSLTVELSLNGIRGVPWLFAGAFNSLETGSTSILDDAAAVSLATSTRSLHDAPDRLMTDLLRFVFFAVGWQDVATDESELHQMVKWGYNYNYFEMPTKLKL